MRENLLVLNRTVTQCSEIVCDKIYSRGMSFGEQNVVEYKARMSTCISKTECLFMIIPRLSYCKVLDRLTDAKNRAMF